MANGSGEGPNVSTKAVTPRRRRTPREASAYILDDQVGHMLRRAMQRHTTIFAARLGVDLTATQWAAMSKLYEKGACSQNLLGRRTAMDAATIKGVVDRLVKRGLVETRPDPEDGRRLVVALTVAGVTLTERLIPVANGITEETLAPLEVKEREQFMALLQRLT